MELQSLQCFKEIVEKIFNGWTALKLCVEHGMGGRSGHQTAIEIMNYMYEYCTKNENLSQYDIQEALEEIMDQEFEAICDDNSISEISTYLVKYLNMCKEQRFADISNELALLPKCNAWLVPEFEIKYISHESDSDSDDADDDGEDEDMTDEPTHTNTETHSSSASVPTVNKMDAEEGWTTVTSRRKH